MSCGATDLFKSCSSRKISSEIRIKENETVIYTNMYTAERTRLRDGDLKYVKNVDAISIALAKSNPFRQSKMWVKWKYVTLSHSRSIFKIDEGEQYTITYTHTHSVFLFDLWWRKRGKSLNMNYKRPFPRIQVHFILLQIYRAHCMFLPLVFVLLLLLMLLSLPLLLLLMMMKY